MNEARPAPSPALRAANERLLALRAQLERQPDRSAAVQVETAVADPSGPQEPPAPLPAHLGWDSPAVTTAVRTRQTESETATSASSVQATSTSSVQATSTKPVPSQSRYSVQAVGKPTDSSPDPGNAPATANPDPDPETSNCSPLPDAFPLHPSLALALLRQKEVAVGRLWLLLRLLDSEGRGWLNRADIEAAFTDPDSPTHLCTPRYLRQLLAEGNGRFWVCEGSDKVWLRGQAKVAAALGVRKLRGRAVELPVSVLLGPIGDLRAHLYATFHSGRCGHSSRRDHSSRDQGQREEQAPPISRASLRELSGVSPRTQQTYDDRAAVDVQPCLAIGGVATTTGSQENAWQHGRAAFTFIDHQGKQGTAGGRYQARRLPNRYRGPHQLVGGRPQRLNRQLADLCHKGYAGNDQPTVVRRYYADGAAAGRVWQRQQGRVLVYWPARGNLGHGRQPRTCFWYMLGTGAV